MSAYIGPMGRLVKFKCPSGLEVTSEPRSSFRTTMGGRVVEQRGPRGRRTWQASFATATPAEVAGLEALSMGVMGRPPWVWVPPDAMSVNALTPNESLLHSSVIGASVVPGPARTAADGFYSFSTVTIPAGQLTYVTERARSNGAARGVPVIPGELYTVSAYGAGTGGTLRALFRNAGGSLLVTPSAAFTGDFTRRSITWRAPAGATNVLLEAAAPSGAVLSFGAPSVTWTDAPQPWAVGRGCSSATVEGLEESLQLAVRGSESINRSAYSFNVRELG